MVRDLLTSMTPVDADIEVVARAAEIVVTTMPHLEISFGAFVGGEWHHYPTARFLDGLGFQAEEYSQINRTTWQTLTTSSESTSGPQNRKRSEASHSFFMRTRS